MKIYNVKFFLRPLQSSSSSLSVSRVSLFSHPSPQKQARQQRMSFFTSTCFVFASSLAFTCYKLNKTLRFRKINIFGKNRVTILTARPSISFWGWQFQKWLCCILPDITLIVSSFDMFCQLWFSWWQAITDKLFLEK